MKFKFQRKRHPARKQEGMEFELDGYNERCFLPPFSNVFCTRLVNRTVPEPGSCARGL